MMVLKRLACLALSATVSGCIASSTLVTLKPDGSGTIEQLTTMTQQAADMIKGMAAMGGGENQPETPDLFSEATARDALKNMGEGVRLLSATPIKTADRVGMKAMYAFDDISKIQLSQKPNTPSAPGMTVTETAPEQLSFSMAKNASGNSVLTIRFPKIDLDPSKKPEEPQDKPDEVPPQAMEMMKQMFKGMKIDLAMTVDGRLVKTTVPYVEGNTVTLMSVDFDKLLDRMDILQKMQDPGSVEEMKQMLKDVPGLKIVTDREVTIEFAPR